MKRDDPIFALLHKADASAPQMPRIEDLPHAVIRRHRCRRIVRSGSLLGCLVVMICAGALFVQQMQSPQLTSTTRPSSENLALAALNADVELHARTAKFLVAGEKRRASLDRSRRSIARDDAIDVIQDERNRAGLTLVSHADRMNQQSQRADDAAEIYRRAMVLFPDTAAATIAAQRLEQLKT